MAFEFEKTPEEKKERIPEEKKVSVKEAFEKIVARLSPFERGLVYPIEIIMYGDDLPRIVNEIIELVSRAGLRYKYAIEKPKLSTYRYKAYLNIDIQPSLIPTLFEILKDVPSGQLIYTPVRRARKR
ncbi:MAG: hypothetical protein QXT67_08905 [Candidatus Bathyarchaeia archaeon]